MALPDHAERFQQEPPQRSGKARTRLSQWARTGEGDSHARETTAIDRGRGLLALDALSTEHRLVLILAVVEGFTCKEIAGICSLPIGTVMSRLSRGRSELRKIFVYSQCAEQSTASVS